MYMLASLAYLHGPDNPHASATSSVSGLEDDRQSILFTEMSSLLDTGDWPIRSRNHLYPYRQREPHVLDIYNKRWLHAYNESMLTVSQLQFTNIRKVS